MSTTVLLVDDHPMLGKGLRPLLESESDMRVIGRAGDGKEAIEQARALSPDVVVMDITMPNLNGIELTRQILNRLKEQDQGGKVEPNMAALYLFGMLNWIVMWFDPERNNPAEISESLVELFLGGYRKASVSGR